MEENFKNQFRITLFDNDLNPTPNFETVSLNKIIRTRLEHRKYTEPSIIEGVEPKEIVKKFLILVLDEEVEGSEPVPSKFGKDGSVISTEVRKYKRYQETMIIDEKEIDRFMELTLI